MTTPLSPDEKKTVEVAQTQAEEVKVEKPLTLEERVGRLEIVIEQVFNTLAKAIHETELRARDEKAATEVELSRALTIMNLGALQSIITVKEVVDQLLEKDILDKARLEQKVAEALKNAVERQQEAAQAAIDAQNAPVEAPVA